MNASIPSVATRKPKPEPVWWINWQIVRRFKQKLGKVPKSDLWKGNKTVKEIRARDDINIRIYKKF